MAQEDNYGKLDRPNSPIKRTTKTLRKSLQKNQHDGEKNGVVFTLYVVQTGFPWGFWSFKSPGFKNIEFYAVTVAVKWRRPLKYVASKFQLANGSLRWEGGGRAASL